MRWGKRMLTAAERSERAQYAANVRWERYHAGIEEPVRESRVVEMRIVDSHRAGVVIRLQAEEGPRGWGRFRVWCNGERVGSRSFGRSGVGDLIAGFLR